MKTVSLVLGSGGARGLAHIGIIRWLEENGYKIESISGCSVGALVGGVYAAGKLDEFEAWVTNISRMDMIALLDVTWRSGGLVKGDKIINTLVNLVGDKLIEDLPITYTAVAADIKGEKEVWMKSGRLFDAIRASISLPLLFTPFRYRGVDLIDGGVLNPVPIAPTFGDDTDITIAVNLGGDMEIEEVIETIDEPKDDTAIDDSSPFKQKINHFIEQWSSGKSDKETVDWGLYDVANQAFDAMQSTIARQKLAAYPADHTIEIARNRCGTLEINRAAEMIEFGYNKAAESLGPHS